MKISIIVTSRAEGNSNHRLPILLDSLRVSSFDPKNIEVLIKNDVNDLEFGKTLDQISKQEYPFQIISVQGEQGRGYIDIHHGYNQLLSYVSKDSKIIGAMADDFTVNGGWDQRIRDAVRDAGDFFIVHQRPHPFIKRDQSGEIFREGKILDIEFIPTNLFDMTTFDMFRDADNLYVIDEAPLWSRALLEACSINGNVFPVSFTDAWTLAIQYVLYNTYGINITRFLDQIYINRTTCAVDQPGDARWNNDRRINFEFIKTDYFKTIVVEQAQRIYEKIYDSVSV